MICSERNKSRNCFADNIGKDYICGLLTSFITIMNKRFLLLLTCLIAVGILAGCDGRKTPVDNNPVGQVSDSSTHSEVDSAVADQEVALVTDSMGKKISNKVGSVEMSYSFPVSGPQPLVNALRAYLSSEMRGCTVISGTDNKEAKSFSNPADGRRMLKYYAEKAFHSLTELSGDTVEWFSPCELSMSVKKYSETKQFVTYYSYYYLYEGGAHGMAGRYGATFDKQTGKKLGNPVNFKNIKALQPLLRKGLKEYYYGFLKDNGETPSPAAIQEYMNDLFIGNGVIPKPSITPCLVEKGVEIIYGQYEIAPYMHGMPTFTIPYSKIAKYLTPEARRLAGLGD